ncbi:MAG: dihydroorotase [Armatimonadetes bacterium]|nr:dihydroorotase [Armatimonadota bacterium]
MILNSSNLLLTGGRVVDPENGIDERADVRIQNGKIADVSVGRALEPLDGEQVVRLTPDHLVCPGFIDVHVHLRDPGQEYKEDIFTGSIAGAAGGFTTLLCMPNTLPPIDTAPTVAYIMQRSREAKGSRVIPIGAAFKDLREERLAEMADLREAGCIAFSDDAFPVQNAEAMRRAMEYCRMLEVPFVAHCEDKSLSGTGDMNEGAVSARLGLRGMPDVSEDIMVARNLLLAEYTGCRLHICHVSTAKSVEMIRQAKARGVQVTAEGCPHHFTLTDDLVAERRYDTNTKMNPPLRTREDVQAVIAGIADGTIDTIATDHAPHAFEEKDVEYGLAPYGIIGLETCVPLTWTQLVHPKAISAKEAVERLALHPARAFGLEGGSLSVGAAADVTVLSTEQEWTFGKDDIRSKSKNTPFIGKEFKGRVMMTIRDGAFVYGGPLEGDTRE